jgi:hypothetical protein
MRYLNRERQQGALQNDPFPISILVLFELFNISFLLNGNLQKDIFIIIQNSLQPKIPFL